MPLDEDKYLYIFMHVQKTGGMTVYHNIESNLHEDEYILSYRNKNIEMNANEGVFAYVEQMTDEQRKKIRFIGGHCVYYGIHTLFPDKVPRYITLIREPYNKTVSEYNFQRTLYEKDPAMRQARGVTGLRGNLLGFDERWFLRNGLNTSASFLYNKLFNRLALIMSNSKIGKIRQMLDTFYFVGITGQQQDFNIIYDLIGIEDKIKKSNVSRKFISDEDIKKSERYLYYRNKYDIQLYRHAVRLNERFKEGHGISFDKIRVADYEQHDIGLKKIPIILFDMLIKLAHRNSCVNKGLVVKMSGFARKYLRRP